MAQALRALVRAVPAPVWQWTSPRRPGRYYVACFHRIADATTSDELCYPTRAFDRLCRYWHDHFDIISIGRLLEALQRGEPASAPTVAITFDDGYADNAEVAAPILQRWQAPAMFFVATAYIGTRHRFAWDSDGTPPRLMRWEQVRALRAGGFDIGSHTATHRRISQLAPASLRRELEASRARLTAELGAPPLDFAYPFGGRQDCSESARAAVRAVGMRSCFSCFGGTVGPSDSPFHLSRVSISPRYHANTRDWARDYARRLRQTA